MNGWDYFLVYALLQYTLFKALDIDPGSIMSFCLFSIFLYLQYLKTKLFKFIFSHFFLQ